MIHSIPDWRIFCFLDNDRQNVIRRWLGENCSPELRGTFVAFVKLIESGGPRTVPGVIREIGSGFYAIEAKRKGEPPSKLIFCYGPFAPYDAHTGEEETGELSLLVGCGVGRDALKSAMVTARDNVATLIREIGRRKRERIS